jgi:hypothetical protein
MSKGVSELISTVLLILVTTIAVGIVLMIGMPAVNRAKEAGITNEAMKNAQVLDDTIREVASEGVGSFRSVPLKINDGDYRIFNYSGNNTGAIEFRYRMEYNSFPLLGVQADGNKKISTGFSTRGLVGYWKLNTINSSNYTLDDSERGNAGQTVTGGEDVFSKQVSGKFGNGLKFDGADDYVSITNQNYFMTIPFSFSAWFNLNQLASDKGGAWETIAESSCSIDPWRSWTLVVNNGGGWNNKIRFDVYDSGKTLHDFASNSAVSINTWYHAVVTIESNGDMKMYVNGVLQTDTANTGSIWTTSCPHFLVGSIYGSTGFNGTIDEVKIYPRALTAEEVQEDYNPKQSDFRITLEYDKIDIMGSGKFGRGTQKICIEKTGSEENKAIVSVSVC